MHLSLIHKTEIYTINIFERSRMNGVMDYNWLGVAFISDDLSRKARKAVEKKMQDLESQVNAEFDLWLGENGLERAMGVVIKKK